jgi:catechol 2,3-dioxygenase-like lactoylglutathione lyase family enzyme
MSQEKAHVSINVSDLGRAVEFYRRFLGQEPAKQYKDYAKFELTDPPLVLSLEPVYHRASDSFNHLGIRLGHRDQVVALHQRLKEIGLVSDYEEDVECCYSRQTKFWLADPDKNLWEIYALTGELARRGGLSASEALAARDRQGSQTTFEHRLGDALPHPWPVESGTVDEVRLRGTFNTPRPSEEKARLLAEALRILKPGGHLLIHGLVSDKAHPQGFPRLPGPAALVKDTPLEAAP